MKLLVTGHRKHKLATYDVEWIELAIIDALQTVQESHGFIRGYAGMAGGVDLWFCQACVDAAIPFVACVPFEGQEETTDEDERLARHHLLKAAYEIRHVKNSWMVEECDMGIVVWDGNKGGTHNVVQQLIEKKKPFIWINPVARVTWNCFV
jgi:uncharacterized phage-like protein YoqJ